ncbi:exodeoxyribonuclease VII small subunit [Parafrankia sp. EUN1f]|uniref:exodeoxyribonuclease VII small subunit n=1 Tax=Parafrankia sp. EUN1f TaxID=102897 RepID=UPI0001C45A96|nr:exodeoxyribonuclease VII small subunit [Parafrankia sp. EUN1f]EFC81990.1 exodeoxyribonuclease VII, small subunit [Parafrankia sp. EUN1f]
MTDLEPTSTSTSTSTPMAGAAGAADAGQPGGGRPTAPASRHGGSEVTYEAARAELEEVVRRLEAGGCSLEESLTLWERGEELASLCQRLLDGARSRLAANPLGPA